VFLPIIYIISLRLSDNRVLRGNLGDAANKTEAYYLSLLMEEMNELNEKNILSPEFDDEWQKSIYFWSGYGLSYYVYHPIDIECEKAIENAEDKSRAGIGGIMWQHVDAWKNEMEKYLKLLVEDLDENSYELLISSQKKWELLIEDDEELSIRAYEQLYNGGTVMSGYSVGVKYDIYRTRALYLEFIYNYWQYNKIYPREEGMRLYGSR